MLVAVLAAVVPLFESAAGAAQSSVANVASQATVTASSQNANTGQTAAKTVDGSHDGYPGDPTREWATAGGRAGSWLNLAWSSAQTLDRVVLYDRPNSNDQVTGATLTFSDGSTVSVPTLNNEGAAVTVSFPARSTTSLRLTIDSVSASTSNVGLAEIEAWTSSGGSSAASSVSAVKPTTVKRLIVVGCRSYSRSQYLCYATRKGHPQAQRFSLSAKARKKPPRPGRVVDVRGWKKGTLIDTTPLAGSGQKTWTRVRGNASSTRALATVHALSRKQRKLDFFVLIPRSGAESSYSPSGRAFTARVPSRLTKAVARSRASSKGGKKPVRLFSLKFKRGTMSLAAIKSVNGRSGTSGSGSGSTAGGKVTNGVVAPTPPSSYAVPSGTVVSNSSQLASALAGSTQNVILADGTYDQSGPFDVGTHRLYAQHLGKAVLTTGLAMNGAGGLVRGLTLNVSSKAKGQSGAIIYAGGSGSQILDTVLRGNKAMSYGVAAYGPSGLIAQRLEIYDVTDVGIRASNNQTVSYGASTPTINSISDIYVNGVTYANPGSSDGTAEAGVWVGHPVANGVKRIKIRNVSWSGLETVNNSWNTTFSDLDIDMSGPNQSNAVGVYLEHFCHYDTFTNFYVKGAHAGFNGEWYAGDSKAGANHTTIKNGIVDAAGCSQSHTAGIYLDEGSNSTTVTGVKFLNQDWAAIGAYKNVGTNNFSGNDYSGLKPGAVQVSNGHI